MEIRTSDLYEAAYYMTKGVTPYQITCRKMEGNVTRALICDFYFEGEAISHLQGEFFRSEAAVNLALFRRCYGEVSNYAKNAMRDYRKSQKIAGGHR